MLVVVQRPVVHQLQRALDIATQEMADRELRGAERGKVLERVHGLLETIRTVGRHVVRQAHADEAAVEAWGEGTQQLQRRFITQRQYRVQAFADAGHALHHRQLRQAGPGQLQERLGIELGIDRGHFGGDVMEAFGVEDFLQGGGGLVGSHLGSLEFVVYPVHRVIVLREQARSHI
jgi:hypothetical protein